MLKASSRRWQPAGDNIWSASLLILLLVAQDLDVLVHERSVCSAEDVTLFEILLLNAEESLRVEVFVGHQRIELAKVIAKPIILTSLAIEFFKQAFALDAESESSEQSLNLHGRFVLLGTFLTVAPDFVHFLFVAHTANVATQGRLQSNYLISFLSHATDERLLADALADHIVLDRKSRLPQARHVLQVFKE